VIVLFDMDAGEFDGAEGRDRKRRRGDAPAQAKPEREAKIFFQ
jgi:hypothetical protein